MRWRLRAVWAMSKKSSTNTSVAAKGGLRSVEGGGGPWSLMSRCGDTSALGVSTEDIENDNLVVENADDSVTIPAVCLDNDVFFRNNLLEKNATVPQALKKLDGMEKWTEVTGKVAPCSPCSTPEKSSLRESVVCVSKQPDSMDFLGNPEGFEIYYAYSTTLASDAGEPRTYKVALKHQDEPKEKSTNFTNGMSGKRSPGLF